ncbi:hypothetical protein [Actinopolyspora mortivallis]|uniref:Uncharacterized protein n=1 Tax=Actinopolyspora mortivallis TaxID=33906 RepID=A0A2T0GZP1_ACTMO|nr:hypothetical protein [Actinopolyspora mortivallis]PRW64578.1 hypothetical protein CEP50_04280 [Actinopolyspora mortivallis]
MTDYDQWLWRALSRTFLVLALGVAGLLVTLGDRARRGDSVLGALILAVTALPLAMTVRGMDPNARRKLRELPRHRRLLTLTALLLACAAVLLALWTLVNLVLPVGSAPLPLAVPLLAAAGLTTAFGRRTRGRRH